MKDPFVKRLLLLSLLLAFLTAAFQLLQGRFVLSNWIWPSLLYLTILSLASWKVAQSGLHKDNRTFITRVYSAIGIRMLFSLFPLIAVVILSNEMPMVFIVIYLFFYLCFTSVEIVALVGTLRPTETKT